MQFAVNRNTVIDRFEINIGTALYKTSGYINIRSWTHIELRESMKVLVGMGIEQIYIKPSKQYVLDWVLTVPNNHLPDS